MGTYACAVHTHTQGGEGRGEGRERSRGERREGKLTALDSRNKPNNMFNWLPHL